MNAKTKHAFVSGSSSGIGLSIAKALLIDGYTVWLNGRNTEKGNRLANSLKQEFGNVHFLTGDASIETDVHQMKQILQDRQIELDLLIANVGSGRCNNELTIELNEFQRVFNLNFYSAVNVCQVLEPLIPAGGSITCISSIAGLSPIGAPIPYACAKAALNMFVKEWAMRLAHRKVRVNAVSPGNVLFPDSVWQKKLTENESGTKDYIKHNVPLNQFVEPDEIAAMVRELAEQPSLTGQNIVIDAGQVRGTS